MKLFKGRQIFIVQLLNMPIVEKNWERVPIDVQSIAAPLSRAAIFLVVTIKKMPDALVGVCGVLGELDDLLKAVGFRDLTAHLSCITGIGSIFWDRLDLPSRPRELKPFAPIMGQPHTAPATEGDLLFHIRAERFDFCFEFERMLLEKLGSYVAVTDEVAGFRYFDARDLLGFVDGTANPSGMDLASSALVGEEDDDFRGGSYVVVQKYLHNIGAWEHTPTALQEEIIGRRKIDNLELDDARRKSHKTLATIVDAEGREHDILRDNMPFGRVGQGEFGTYFIGYSRYLWVIEKMLERMFLGDPPGEYDRLLDFSKAVTGITFFAPAKSILQVIARSAQP